MNILFSLLLMTQVQVQPNNEPVWMWMPTDTVEQRADKEVARKEWAKRKMTLDAMAATAARKQRLYYRQNQYRYQNHYRYQNQYRYQNNYQRQSYGYRWRTFYIRTPTGTVVYRIPY